VLAFTLVLACRGPRQPAGSPQIADARGNGGRGARPPGAAGDAAGGMEGGTDGGGENGTEGGRASLVPGSAGEPEPSANGGETGGAGTHGADGAAGTHGADAGAPGGAPTQPRAPFSVVRCTLLDSADDCDVSGVGTDLVLQGDVLTPGVVYEGGSVRVGGDGVIQCVGCDCDTSEAWVVTCARSAIAPGFVNPHDHVAYAADPPRPLGPERYEHRHDWRLGLRGHTAIAYEGGASAVERAAHELRMLLGGATSIAGGAGNRGLLRNPDMPELGEGLPTAQADSETFPLDDSSGRYLASGCDYGSGHADAEDVARAGAFLAHLGEGVDREAENELACALDPEFGLIAPTTGIVHAVALRAERAAELGSRSALVVWSPRSNVSLYGNTAPVPLLLRSGVEVALGTDWLLSGSMSLVRELQCARDLSKTYFDGALDEHALFLMVTSAAARAVGAPDVLGRLSPGALADISVVARRERAAYGAVTAAESADFQLILRGGAPLYGRRTLVEALGTSGCEALLVCGAEQSVCTADSGFTLSELVAAADATYPLFTCDTPPDEPTCVPARPGEYDGVLRDGDADGDGIADESDACPHVFDPLRPLDDGAQADADADGLGDACDPCPLEPTLGGNCSRSGDRDGDGLPDGIDLCPDVSDPTQSDADGDGRGDACDWCDAPNPGVFPCIVPIAAVRDRGAPNHPQRHALLEIRDAVVSALRPDSGSSRGFYLVDAGTPYSGLFAYTGKASPGVAVGERLTLRGRYDVYYELDELVAPLILERAPGAPPAPIAVTATDIGDGGPLALACDSMLVSISDASVIDTNPDAPSDYDETGLDGALRLDDLLYPELDNLFLPGARFRTVTGILGRSFEHQKLYPRDAADLAE
jgi:imidazolonepropionase-like amidohydrolase